MAVTAARDRMSLHCSQTVSGIRPVRAIPAKILQPMQYAKAASRTAATVTIVSSR